MPWRKPWWKWSDYDQAVDSGGDNGTLDGIVPCRTPIRAAVKSILREIQKNVQTHPRRLAFIYDYIYESRESRVQHGHRGPCPYQSIHPSHTRSHTRGMSIR
jgi:hypothetical protein